MKKNEKILVGDIDMKAKNNINRIIIAFALLFLFFSQSLFALEKKELESISKNIKRNFAAAENATDSFIVTGNIEEYLNYAALNNPGLKSAFYHWKASLEKMNYAGALPDPMISYAYFIENIETRVGPQEWKLSLKQTFPWIGTLGAKKDIANEEANTAFRRYQAEKLKLFYSVKAAYYDLYYLGREIALTKDNLELLKFWEAVARTKYKVALSTHPDIIKAEVELGKLEDRLESLQEQIRPTVTHLRVLANLPKTVSITIPDTIDIVESEIELQDILDETLQNNPDLNAMVHLIDKERAGVRLAGKSNLPNFTIGVDYIETGDALNPSMDESGKDPWIVGVGINLPLWFGKNGAKKGEAKAKLQAAQYRYAETQNSLEVLVEKIVFRYSDALRKIRLYRDGLIPKAEQALKTSYTAYQVAEVDFLSLLDAQRQLLAFQLKFDRAIADLARHRAEIEMITGNELNYK